LIHPEIAMSTRSTSAPISARVGEVLNRDPAAVRQRVEAMEALLEGLFVVPGTRFRVGLDALLGLVPVGGTVIAGAFGSWLAWEARNLGMPKSTFVRMAGNIAFDTALGAIPVLGTVYDFFFRSNTRNLKIIRRWLDEHHPLAVDPKE
jgi:Domain of unknown function (DUF4112)